MVSATCSTSPIRRAVIVVPFLVAYGLGIYLVTGAISDAFSGQSGQRDSGIVAAGPTDGAADIGTSVAPALLADAVEALERADAVRKLVRGQELSVIRAGPWTAGAPGTAGPSPTAGTGVALTIELPEPVAVDLSTLPSAEAADPESSVADTRRFTMPNVSSLLVLYDPATDEIAAVHPVPDSAPAPPRELGPPPGVARSDDADRPDGAIEREGARG